MPGHRITTRPSLKLCPTAPSRWEPCVRRGTERCRNQAVIGMLLSHASWVDKTGDLLDELRTCIGRVVAETRVNGLPNCLRYRPYDPTVSRDLVLVSSRLPYVADTDCCLHRLIQKLGAYCDTTSVSGFGGEPTTVDHEINAKAHLSDVVSRVAAPGPACVAGTSGTRGHCPPGSLTISKRRTPCSLPATMGVPVPGGTSPMSSAGGGKPLWTPS